MQINGRTQRPGETIALTLLENYEYWVILEPARQRLYLNSTGRILDRDVSTGTDAALWSQVGFFQFKCATPHYQVLQVHQAKCKQQTWLNEKLKFLW